MNTSALILPAAVLVLSLAGCGGGTPVPAPTEAAPTITTGPADPPPPPPPAVTVAAVQVSATGIDIVGDDGETISLVHYTDAAADAVATLTDAFGSAPAVSDRPGGSENPPSRVYDWSGFQVIDGDGLTIMRTDFVVDVSTHSVAGIDVFAVPGLRVGDDFANAVLVQDSDGGFPGLGLAAVDTQDVDPVSVGEAPGVTLHTFLAIYGPESGSGPIEHFIAPSPDWGV